MPTNDGQSYCLKHGQTEIGVFVHQGKEFAALGSSVNGKNITAYTRGGGKYSRMGPSLTSWCGRTILDCRCEIVETYHTEEGKPVALVYSLTRGRFIVGYALDRDGMLFRGELMEGCSFKDASYAARQIAESCAMMDQEDEEQFETDDSNLEDPES